ncbi:MAG: hypothetical protein LBQ79_07395 [Deltaproteobacteria bacterium]|jgi:hypothetical protein|nr:hypothetical protein [Deltaproteobacteria bacterium]
METVLRFLITPQFMILACSGIGIFFGYFLIKCRRKRDEITLAISEAVRIIDAGNRSIRRVPRTEHFANNFVGVSKSIERNALLREKWTEFRESLFMPEGGGTAVFASQPAEAFFSEDGFLLRHYNERFFSAVPNLLTGMGILGTFLGLAAGVELAVVQGLLIPQAADGQFFSQQTLNALLNATGLVFVTSVLGLGFSIVFSLAEKRFFREAAESLAGFNELLDASVVRCSPESLAMSQFCLLFGLKGTARGDGLPGLTALTGNRGKAAPFVVGFEEIAGRVLASSVTDSIMPELQRIGGILENIRSNRSLEAAEAVKLLVREFLESLRGATDEAAESVAGNLRQMAEICNPITDSLRDVNLIIARNVREAAGIADVVAKVSSDLNSVSASLAEVAAKADNSVLGMAAAAEGASERFGKMAESLDATVTRTLEGQTAAVELLNDGLKSLGVGIGARMDDAENKIWGLFASVELGIESLRAEARKALEDSAAGAAEVAVTRIAEVGAGLEGMFAALAGELSARAGQKAESLAKGLAEGLAEGMAGLPGEARKIGDGIGERIAVIGAGLETLIAGAAGGQRQIASETQLQIEKLGVRLFKAIGTAQESQDRRNSAVLDLIGRIDEGLISAFSSAAERQGQLHASALGRIDEIGKVLDGTLISVRDGQSENHFAVLGRIEAMSDAVATLLDGAVKGLEKLRLVMMDKVEGCADGIGERISSIADAQSQVFRELAEKLDLYNGRFAEIIAKAPAGIEGLLVQLKGSLTTIIADISDLSVRISDGYGKITGEVNAKTLEFIENQRAVLEKHNEDIQSVMAGQKGTVESVNEAVGDMLLKFHDHVSYLDDSYGKHSDMFAVQMKEVKVSLEELLLFRKSHGARLDGLDDVISRTLEKLENSYMHNISQAERFLHEIDGSFAKAVVELKDILGHMGSLSAS